MQIFTDRHALHQIPELDRNLPETLRYLNKALEGLSCRGGCTPAATTATWRFSWSWPGG